MSKKTLNILLAVVRQTINPTKARVFLYTKELEKLIKYNYPPKSRITNKTPIIPIPLVIKWTMIPGHVF